MIVQCEKCKRRYDDEFRDTGCPHKTFAANDGDNNFSHHPESYLSDDLDKALDDFVADKPKDIMRE
jgi:hypothetical protein